MRLKRIETKAPTKRRDAIPSIGTPIRILRRIMTMNGIDDFAEERLRDDVDITAAIETHSDSVLRVCTLYFGLRTEREDAFQETFLKYALSDKVFKDEEHRKAWLIRVATNACKDMLKRAEAKTILADEIDEAARLTWNDNPNPAEDRSGTLTEALQQLDEKYRLPLYLKYYEGYTGSEIASIMGVAENTVYTNLARGRDKLKEVLARE